MIGETLQNGKYKIVRELGHGGFGITYEGIQAGLNRRVAIKEFFMEDYCKRDTATSYVSIVSTGKRRTQVENFKKKFVKEAQMIASIEDIPHIIRIYDVFEENGTAYYVMQFIEGGSLERHVKQHGRLDEITAIKYVQQIGEALSKLHQRRIMHLDVKPANILYNDGQAILIDYGISKHYNKEGNATTTTPVGISKGFAPIEQYKQDGVKEFSPEIDVYSLGATLYYLITGITPQEAPDLSSTPITFPTFVSSRIRNAVSMAMKPNKKERLQSVQDFLTLLSIDKDGEKESTLYDDTINFNKDEKSERDNDFTHLYPAQDKYGNWGFIDQHGRSINNKYNTKEAKKAIQASEIRSAIEQLEKIGEYKEAYNRCVDCINLGINVDYATKKLNLLLPVIKRKEEINKWIIFLIISIVFVSMFLLSASLK